MKKDIHSLQDIELLINQFYDKVKEDKILEYYFNQFAKVNWDIHLPRMISFWENVVFSSGNFEGNPMVIHQQMHEKCPMKAIHFEHWLKLFKQTVDELFDGEKAEFIKLRAMNISGLMQIKIIGQ